MAPVVTAAVVLVALSLGAAGTAFAASAAAAYTNQPIVPPQSSGELSPAGDAFEYVQFASTVYLPQADGWCKNNVGCSDNITNGNSEQCYSIFYPVPNPASYNYPNIATTQAPFNTYAMTFNARLYLMDLDQNGVGPLTEADPTTCSPLIQEMAFVSMWINNIRDGFSCPNNKELTFNGSPFNPPCQEMCYNLMNSPCPFQSAFLYGSQSVMQYCELLPTACGRTALARQNCISAATAGRPMVLALVVGLVTALLAAALL